MDQSGDPEKLNCEDTSTTRHESVSINIKDVPEYQRRSSEKQKKLTKEEEKILGGMKNSNGLFRSYFVYAADEDYSDYDPETRNRFVAFVFLITFILLFLNGVVAFSVRFAPGMKDLIKEHQLFAFIAVLIACGILLCINYGMVYFPNFFATPPCTWIILIIAFLCYCVIISVLTLRYNTVLIIVGIAATAIVVFICVLIALTKLDFTKCTVLAIVLVVASMAASLLILVLRLCGVYIKPLHMAVVLFGVLVSSFVLIIEMQMILGGKTIEISEDDLALPAYMVYTSIITIFLQILRFLHLSEIFDAFDED